MVLSRRSGTHLRMGKRVWTRFRLSDLLLCYNVLYNIVLSCSVNKIRSLTIRQADL